MKKKTERKIIFETEEIIVGLSAILLIISAFLTWGAGPNYSQSGLISDSLPISDGMLVMGLGVIALVLLLVDIRYHIPAWVPMAIGLIAFVIGSVDYYNMNQAVAEFGGKVGGGLKLAVIASLGVVIGSVLDLFRNQLK